MKNKTLTLAKVLLKNGEGLGIKGSGTTTRIIVYLTMAFVAVSMISSISLFVSFLIDMLRQIGQEGVVLSWGAVAASAITFIFGIIYIMSTFYFSSDIENLLPLPLKPKQIVGAKFLVVVLYEYLFTTVIFLPILIIYGVKMGSGPLHYLYGIVILMLLPIIPLALASVIVMIIMRFVNITKHKDAFAVFGGLLAIFFGLGINMVIQSTAGGMTPQQLQALLQQGQNSLIGITSSLFPTAEWAAKALANSSQVSGLLSFLLFTGVSAAVFIGLLYLGELVYLRGVMGLSEVRSGRGGKRNADLDRMAVRSSVLRSYTMIELKLLFRTPIYFLNCVAINFLMPVFFIFPLMMNNDEVNIVNEISKAIGTKGSEGIIVAVAFAIAIFIGGTNGVAPTAISREGQELFVKKYIPVHYSAQITAKLLSGFLLGMVGIFMMVLFAVIVFGLPVSLGLLIFFTAWLPILFTCFTGLLIDLYNPKLNWDSEQKAVKQNVNVVYNIFIGMALAAVTAIIAITFRWNLLTALIILISVYGILNILMFNLLYKVGVRRFARLEG